MKIGGNSSDKYGRKIDGTQYLSEKKKGKEN
jgi:hypothetical protein